VIIVSIRRYTGYRWGVEALIGQLYAEATYVDVYDHLTAGRRG